MLKIGAAPALRIASIHRSRDVRTQFPGVQHLSSEEFCEFAAINFVAQHRMPEVMKMNANLMGASAMQSAFDQAHSADELRRDNRFSPPALEGSDRHSLSMHRMAADFFLNRSGALAQFARDQRQINFFDSFVRRIASISRRWASSVLATTRQPLVSLSRRCTIPGRSFPPIPESVGKWCRRAFTSVCFRCPAPG